MDPLPGTCSGLNGFYPGWSYGPLGLSTFLKDLNDDKTKEATHAFAMLSTYDDLILFGDIVWGQYTSEYPT